MALDFLLRSDVCCWLRHPFEPAKHSIGSIWGPNGAPAVRRRG